MRNPKERCCKFFRHSNPLTQTLTQMVNSRGGIVRRLVTTLGLCLASCFCQLDFVEVVSSAFGSISGSFNSDPCIRINAVLSCQQLTEVCKRREPKRAFYCSNSIIIFRKRTLLHTFGLLYAALLNQEYAFSLGFAAYLVSVVAPNARHVPGVVTILCRFT